MSQTNSNSIQLAPTKFCDVDFCELIDDEAPTNGFSTLRINVKQAAMPLMISPDNENLYLSDPKSPRWFPFKTNHIAFITKKLLIITSNNDSSSYYLRFHSSKEAKEFEKALKLCQLMKKTTSIKEQEKEKKDGIFDSRTENNSADLYFQFYGYLNQQQNMLQDYVRTSTYQRSILCNSHDFDGKIVLDVGAGTGLLSFFAVQAGAKRVYAIEASSMAIHCQELVRTNNLTDRIIVVPGKVEDAVIPEKVDIIISEPMGYSLVNERMLESYVHARKFLKPGGRMFPTTSAMYFALFSDELVYQENVQKSAFWFSESFHGINLSALKSQAFSEIFKQPVIDTWSSSILCSELCTWTFDFEKDPVEKLHLIEVPFELKITRPCLMHGIASWFDVSFNGSHPDQPLTHWYQVRYFFTEPAVVHSGTIVSGRIVFNANERLSYDVDIYVKVNGIEKSNRLDLKNPNFRYMSGGVQMPASNYYDGSFNNTMNQPPPEHPEQSDHNNDIYPTDTIMSSASYNDISTIGVNDEDGNLQ